MSANRAERIAENQPLRGSAKPVPGARSSCLSVAVFTPLPPASTGTADYAEALIRELETRLDLTVFTKIPQRFDAKSYDAVLYHLNYAHSVI